MEEPVKGEVRRLADIFSTDDTERASLHVKSAIDSQKHTLRTLQGFANENEELIKLVENLPNKVSHNIMVPFGKSAFFPGQLVHTNEFLVLLGESYYAECSAKQTAEILDRRGNLLNSRIDAVKSQLADLDMESRFFSETLAEASGGVVDIREEFVESGSMAKSSPVVLEKHGERSLPVLNENVMETNIVDLKDEDKEHELLMARLEELEAAEAAAEALENEDEDRFEEFISENKDHDRRAIKDRNGNKRISDQSKDISKLNREVLGMSLTCGRPDLRSPGDLLKFEEWKRNNTEKTSDNVAEKTSEAITLSAQKEINRKQQVELMQTGSQKTRETSIPERSSKVTEISDMQKSREISSAKKIFTGTVLERTESTPEVPKGPNETQTRPLSKFKMRQTDR